MNPVLAHVSRHERRKLLDTERRLRKCGDWGPWENIPLPDALPDMWNAPMRQDGSRGWTAQVRAALKNRVFCVLVRPIVGGEKHLAVSSLSGERPTWHEMQRIKDEIAGEDATAVEVYPPRKEIVDGADMFHIWTVPKLPFSLHEDGP